MSGFPDEVYRQFNAGPPGLRPTDSDSVDALLSTGRTVIVNMAGEVVRTFGNGLSSSDGSTQKERVVRFDYSAVTGPPFGVWRPIGPTLEVMVLGTDICGTLHVRERIEEMAEMDSMPGEIPDRLDQAVSKLSGAGFPLLAAAVVTCRAERDDAAGRMVKLRHLVGLVEVQDATADEDAIRAAERAEVIDEVVADLTTFRELAGDTAHDNLRTAIDRVSRHGRKGKP